MFYRRKDICIIEAIDVCFIELWYETCSVMYICHRVQKKV